MNGIKKIRILCFALAATLLGSNIFTVTAYAAGRNTAFEHQNEVDAGRHTDASDDKVVITGVEITDLDEPVAGRMLDNEATVLAYKDGVYNGISWKIPVIWVDESGKTATVAVAGVTYLPVFAFYVPDGYELKGVDFSGLINVKLPAFLKNIYLNNSLRVNYSGRFSEDNLSGILSATDPSTGITYIKGPGVVIESPDGNNTSENAGADNGGDSESTDNGNSETPADSDEGSEEESEEESKDEVLIHCQSGIVEKYGHEFLDWFVKTIKYEVQPQAVNILCDGLISFDVAQEYDWFSNNIGLYIYGEEGSSGMAAVSVHSWKGSEEDGEDPDLLYMDMRIDYNIASFATKDDAGYWTVNSNDMTKVVSTTVHEMLHAYMYDYNRNGSLGRNSALEQNRDKYALPDWLCEGAAEAVSGAFPERVNEFKNYYDSDLSRYTESRLYDIYQDKSYDTSKLNDYGAYSLGMLAVYYISGLSAQKYFNADFTNLYLTDSYYYRQGFDRILSDINYGKTLDSIINEISGGKYKDTTDFETQFISSKSHETTKSCVALLNFFNSMTTTASNGELQYISGSMLKEFGTLAGDLLQGVSTENKIYKISDTKDYVDSTVDPYKAMQTGTKSADTEAASSDNIIPIGTESVDEAARMFINDEKDTPEAAAAESEEIKSGAEEAEESETPATEAGDESRSETSEADASETMAAETPATEISATETSGAENTVAENTVAENIAAEADESGTNLPVSDTTSGTDTYTENCGMDTAENGNCTENIMNDSENISLPDISISGLNVPDTTIPDTSIPAETATDVNISDGSTSEAGSLDADSSDADSSDAGSSDADSSDDGSSDDGSSDENVSECNEESASTDENPGE